MGLGDDGYYLYFPSPASPNPFAIVFASATASKALPAAAKDFIMGYAINWGPVFASGVLIVLPMALAALLLQRYIVRGLTLGAFK